MIFFVAFIGPSSKVKSAILLFVVANEYSDKIVKLIKLDQA